MEQHIVMANGQAQDSLKNKIMRTILILLFVLVQSNFTYSQIDKSVSKNLFKINLVTPGLTYERGLSENSTLNVEIGFSLDITTNDGQLQLLKIPFIRSQYRFYYNIDSRIQKKKSILGNSAGFVAPLISYYSKPLSHDIYVSGLDGFTLGGVWGFQKTYKSNLNLSINTGLGYNFSNKVTSPIVPI
jgi:hypothetical protein